MAAETPGRSRRRLRLHGLLALPFAGLLYPPLYAREDPALAGVPFFYWYQLVWVIVTAALIYAVVRRSRPAGDDGDSP